MKDYFKQEEDIGYDPTSKEIAWLSDRPVSGTLEELAAYDKETLNKELVKACSQCVSPELIAAVCNRWINMSLIYNSKMCQLEAKMIERLGKEEYLHIVQEMCQEEINKIAIDNNISGLAKPTCRYYVNYPEEEA